MDETLDADPFDRLKAMAAIFVRADSQHCLLWPVHWKDGVSLHWAISTIEHLKREIKILRENQG